jgi:drug/metabolite transporter (DMT)-like permease
MPPDQSELRTGVPVPNRSDVIKGRLYLVLLCLGWGGTWPMMRIALTEIPPFSMRVGGLMLGIMTLTLAALLQRRSLRIPNPRTWVHLCVASLFNIVAFSICTPFAQLAADTSRVAILVYTMPIWATLMAVPILGERLTATRALALTLCVAGMAVLIYPLATQGIPFGLLLALGASVGWAAGTVYLKWARLDGDPMAVAIWQLVIGLVVVAAVMFLVDGSLRIFDAHVQAIGGLLVSGIVGTGVSYFLWFDIVRRLPATTASLGVLASPVVGVVASMLILGERPTPADLIGFALMFIASACVLLRPEAARPRA